jgi:hypothetical protein
MAEEGPRRVCEGEPGVEASGPLELPLGPAAYLQHQFDALVVRVSRGGVCAQRLTRVVGGAAPTRAGGSVRTGEHRLRHGDGLLPDLGYRRALPQLAPAQGTEHPQRAPGAAAGVAQPAVLRLDPHVQWVGHGQPGVEEALPQRVRRLAQTQSRAGAVHDPADGQFPASVPARDPYAQGAVVRLLGRRHAARVEAQPTRAEHPLDRLRGVRGHAVPVDAPPGTVRRDELPSLLRGQGRPQFGGDRAQPVHGRAPVAVCPHRAGDVPAYLPAQLGQREAPQRDGAGHGGQRVHRVGQGQSAVRGHGVHGAARLLQEQGDVDGGQAGAHEQDVLGVLRAAGVQCARGPRIGDEAVAPAQHRGRPG